MRVWRKLLGTTMASGAALTVLVSQGRTAQDTMTTPASTDYCAHDAPISVEMVREYTNEPLLHDCQAFVLKSGNGFKYGAVFRIIPASKSLTQSAIDAALGINVPIIPAGVLRGLFEPTPVPRRTKQPDVAAVALIVAHGDYTQLHLTTGKNCLYVFRYKEDDEAPVQWSGLVVHIADTESNCPKTPGTGKLLEARPKSIDGFSEEADYPEVARWDWDATNSEQYIGIKCGAAWCEIGKTGFDASDPIPVPSGATPEERKVRLIKGWHDRQFLAFKNSNGLVPSQVMGVLIPNSDLGDSKRAVKEFQAAATILLISSLPEDRKVLDAYEKKYHIDVPGDKGPMELSIRLKDDDEWEAKIRNPNNKLNKEVTRKLKYHKPEKYKELGIVRWRWMLKDEGTWIRCSEGCCEMTG